MTIERLAGGAEMLVALAPDDGDEETAPTAGVSPFQSFTDNLFPQKQLLDASVLMRQQVEDGLRLVGILDVSSAELNKPTHSLSPDEGLYLTALAVHPAYRRRGVARALVDAAAARAAGIGRPALLLHVEKDNDGANRFYQAAGFDAPAVDKRYEQFAKSLDLSTERHVLYRLQLAARAAS
ncbi:acyl-CoA N-acyltransferase [Pelagophyceae sp. CCMP2097]|nr:acyl-CoA N-acyltransferase [Pelagophyceae sp. CCMP2097]